VRRAAQDLLDRETPPSEPRATRQKVRGTGHRD